jgi:hypothetical protein
MTPFLIFAPLHHRLDLVVLLPFEVGCDTIDDELARRGVWLG